VAASRLSSQTSYRGVFGLGLSGLAGDMLMLWRMNALDRWGTFAAAEAPSNSTIGISSPTILSMNDNWTSGGSFFLKGVADGTWSGNSIGQGINHIGGYYSPPTDQTSNMDLGMLLMSASPFSDALRKRVEKNTGFSFKIACS
jgi:hypothetical protein